MKRSMFIAFCLLICAGTAFAQPGNISVCCDPTMVCANIPSDPVLHLYVGHTIFEANAVQFSVDYDGLLMLPNLYLTETVTSPFLAIGTSTTSDDGAGISIAYGACYSGTLMVLDIVFLIQGTIDPCTYVTVEADPAFDPPYGGIVSVNCTTGEFEFPSGGEAIVNPVPGICETGPPCECVSPVPVEESTWGQVKALYQ